MPTLKPSTVIPANYGHVYSHVTKIQNYPVPFHHWPSNLGQRRKTTVRFLCFMKAKHSTLLDNCRYSYSADGVLPLKWCSNTENISKYIT